MRSFVADFETTTNPDNCYVWAYAIREVSEFDSNKETIIGTNIDDFMHWCEFKTGNDRVYLCNLKFDGQFIISWLYKHGFKHVSSNKRASKTFTTLISDKGLWYSIEVVFKLKNKNVNKIVFYDSLKLLPLSVRKIAKAFHLPINKLKIDYDSHNDIPAGTPLTPEEEAYVTNDVVIVAHGINYFHSQGYDKITIGSCALDEYKKITTKQKFKKWFPIPKYHDDVKQSYRGGYTHVDPKLAGKNIKNGLVLDVNSIYPYVMHDRLMPYGTPIFFKGKYEEDELYPLYIQMIRCQFELKKGKVPTAQVKYHGMFRMDEYLTSSNFEEVTLCLNSVDLKIFLEHYEVYNLEYINGWKFRGTNGLFKEYIDKWNGNKIKAKEEKNPGLYLLSKLFLNSLGGKFGTDNKSRSKIPYMDKKGVLHYYDTEVETKDPVYIAVASFMTSYAREITIAAIQRIMDNYNNKLSKAQFVYADTDSLHVALNGESVEEFLKNCGLYIHPTELGAWKHESTFKRGKFLRKKCYIEQTILTEEEYNEGIADSESEEERGLYSKDKNGFYKKKVTVAGLPASCYNEVTFKNFEIGASYSGKKQPVLVPGGVVLKSIEFTIKK